MARTYYRPGEDKVAICAGSTEAGIEVTPQFLASAIRWLLDGDAKIVEIAIHNGAGGMRLLDPQILGGELRRPPVRRRARRRRASE